MLKETDLWIDWGCEGELEDLLDKVATHGVPPELGAKFASRLADILLGAAQEEMQAMQEYVSELEGMIEGAGK